MACNTLENTKDTLREKNLIDATNNVSEENYHEVEELIKTYQNTAEKKYGLEEQLFNLRTLSRKDATGKNDFTTFRLEYSTKVFDKLDELVDNYNIQQKENQEIADFTETFGNMNKETNQFFDQEGNVYATAEDLLVAEEQSEREYDLAIAGNSINQTIIQLNYEDYLAHKKTLIYKIEKKIQKLLADKRITNDTSVNKVIRRLINIKEKFEQDIDTFAKSNNKLETLDTFFDKDFDLINNLLEDVTLDNLFLAKDLFEYLKNTSDIRISNAAKNGLFNPAPNSTYEKDVLDIISKVNNRINIQERIIEEAVDKVFLTLLEKNQEVLSKLYPNKSLDEIRTELLQKLQDVSWIESKFFATGENVISSNNIIDTIIRLEYEKEQLRELAKSDKITQKINAILIPLEKELTRLGKKVTSKLGGIVYTGYDYRFLYQKDSKGNPQSSLIGKYSKVWEDFDNALKRSYGTSLFAARQRKDWAEVEQLLTKKINDLSAVTEFVNLPLLHDVVTSDIKYDEFKRGTNEEAEAYKQELISKIGQEEYDNIVEQQRDHLDNYFDEVELITEQKLMSENVSSVPALSDIARQNLQISISRLNPLNFLDSMTAGRKGMIEYTIGTQSNEKPSYMKYNSYIPKHHNNAGIDTNFYDKNFDFIANNPVIYEFWKAMREGTYLIAENLIDSNLRLNKNSLLLFKKSFSEESINKEVGSIIKQGLGKMINLKQFVKNVISAKEPVYDNNEIVALPAQVKSFDTEVNSEFNILKTEVANIVGQKIEDNTRIVFDSLTKEKQQQIAELTGFPTIAEFQSSINKNVFSVRELKTYSQMKVMEQQTLNLPLMIKAFLELSAEHKARTNALNEVNIYREKSKSIKNQRNTASQRENEDRKNEITRQDFFYNRVVLNHSQKDHSGNASKVLIKMMKSYEFDNKVIGKHFYKNFTKEEKKIYTSVINRLAKIEEELEQETTDSKVLSLLQEKEDLEARIRILGKDYLLSALFDNVFNELTVRVGLGYNLLANIKNKLQGYTSLLSRDGEFWSRGNIYPVNHFVSLNKLRYINPSYKKEWDKSVLFIKQLNLIQDGTNELQRAESKIKKKTRFLSPMYGTEVVEYYNQVPGILAMAMDMEIKDVNGVPHPLFDGSTFTAYTNDNGNLKLKDEFRTPENIQTFEKMESEEMINWKISVENMTRSLHGDYSKTGVTQIKGNIYTKPLMVFKTWIPRYIATRYKYKQKNLITGNEETGYMISSLLNKKTSLTGGLMLAVTGAMGILSASPVLVGLPLVITLLFAGYAKYKMGKSNKDLPLMVDTTEPIAILAQASYVMKMLRPDKLFEVPINTIVGSELIKPVEFSADKNLTPQEARDVRLMARNMQNTIILMMIKFAIQGLLRFNEDDEPKGEVGSEQRKRYEAQQKKKEEMKVKYNFTENLMTGMLQETSLALEPTSLATTMGSKSGLQGPIDKLIKSSIALMRLSHEGDDEIQKGNRAGQSKSGNSLRKFFLPSLFRDLGHDTWRGGFETSMEKEWVNNETIDGIFDTDYKVDKTKAEKERAKIKLHYIEDWEEKNKKDIKELSEEDKAKIEKAAKREAKKESPNSDRDNYDKEQDLIEK